LTDFPRILTSVAFALAAMVLVVRPLYVHDPHRVGPSLLVALVAAVALILWLAARALAEGSSVRRRASGVGRQASGVARQASGAGYLPALSPESRAPNSEPHSAFPRPHLALALMLVAVFAGLLTAAHRRPAIGLACEWISTLAAIFVLLQTGKGVGSRLCEAPEGPAGKRLATPVPVLAALLLATGAVVALYGIHQYAFELPRLRSEYWRDPAAVVSRLEGIEPGSWMQQRFEKRLANQEAFSTFAIANSFAGYLVILLPLAIGMLLDEVRRSAARSPPYSGPLPTEGPDARRLKEDQGEAFLVRPGAVALAAVVLAMGVALFLTRSRGGYVTALVALGALGVGAVWPRVRRFARVLIPAGVAALVLLAAAVVWRIHARGVEGALGPSMRFRVDYWTGAVKMLKDYPVFGVGLGAFGDYYTRYKSPESPEDVRQPHNLIFGLWTQMGLLGLAGLAGLCAAFAQPGPATGAVAGDAAALSTPSRAPRPPRARRALTPAPHSGLGPVAVPLGLVLPVWIAAWTFGQLDAFVCVFGALVWMAVAAGVLWGRPAGPLGRLTRLGLIAGALAFLVHSMMDLDESVPAIVATVLGLLVLRASSREPKASAVPSAPHRQRRWPWFVALAAVSVGSLWFAYGVVLPMLEGEGRFEAARSAEAEAGDLLRRGRKDLDVAAKYRLALTLYRRALEADPLLADAHLALAQAAFQEWRVQVERPIDAAVRLGPDPRPARPTAEQVAAMFQEGMSHLNAAQRLDPRRAQFAALRAEMEREAARHARTPDDRRDHLAAARAAADFLVDQLYPTNVRFLLLRARILEAAGDPAGARRDYEAALRYDALQRDPLLRLAPDTNLDVEATIRRLAPSP
jgi:tetratricopeptide (TPR) repeat protein